MTKHLMIGALALAALTALPAGASAQSWGYGDRDRDGRYERWERRADRNRHDGGRYTDRERHNDWRRGRRDQWRDRYDRPPYGHAYGYRRWHRGAVIPHDYRRSWYVDDYRRYGWRAPPRGYGYYRTDTGDIVVAAIATGVILSLLND
ncbi:RcnB family protein [Brevundimonas sp.]|uniref:RcnB family protein n=1 Tax=Brevundimonas sp. TaxID=1871086 RepID=UPI002C631670|nr:RcnB family protein [Brevundimonas sp.]HWQ86393.1 RcnB family protein [Brevundimonas sp.]